MLQENKRIADEVYNRNFQEHLKEFQAALSLPESKRKSAMAELRDKVSNKMILTFRQVDAIRSRCQNVLDGTYGNTKTSGQMAYGAPPAAK